MFAAIHIPQFALQAALRPEPEWRAQPAALIDAKTTGSVLLEVNGAARKFGVAEGLTASQALARCPSLAIKPRSATQESAASGVLLQTAWASSPYIESTSPGVCTVDLKGLGLKTDAAARSWANRIQERLESFYLTAHIGFAPTPELALLAARASAESPSLFVWHDSVEFLAPLSIGILEPPPEFAKIFSLWGVRTVGEFLKLGQAEISERLGPGALELRARLSIDSIRPLQLALPPAGYFEEIELEHEIETAEPLLFLLRRFVEQLSRRLDALHLVVAEFQLRLGLASGAAHTRDFKIPSPTGNVAALFQILRTHLETLRTDSPIISLRLEAFPGRPAAHQFSLFESALRDPNQFAETLARLIALSGAENAGSPRPEATHRPDSFRLQTPNFDAPHKSAPEAAPAGLCLRRFRPPRPAQLEFRDDQPVKMWSNTASDAVIEARGPFVSSGRWWDNGRWAREEWDVRTAAGDLYRVFRSDEGCFLEGVYD